MRRIIYLLMILPLFLIAQDKNDPQHKVKVGDNAPNFTLHYQAGKKVELSSLKGKVIMLQFTASWCPVCIKEMPHIEKEIFQKHINDTNFVLVAIDLKEGDKEIEKLKKASGITYPILYDKDGKIFELYAEKDAGVTRNILIDKDGKIVYLTRLFVQEQFDGLVKKIDELLSK